MIDEKKYVKIISNTTKQTSVGDSAEILNQDITILANGVYRADAGYTGFGTVTVNVPSPSGSVTYTENGTYDITNYASVTISVPIGTETLTATTNGTYTPSGSNIGFSTVTVNVPVPTLYRSFSITDDVLCSNRTAGIIDFTGITDIEEGLMYRAYYGNTSITAANMSSITSLTSERCCYKMFQNSYVESFNLSSLTTVSGDYCCAFMFDGSKLSGVADLSSVTTISASYGLEYMFRSTEITKLLLNNVKEIQSHSLSTICSGCQYLTEADLSSVISVSNRGMEYSFLNCVNLTTLKISSLTTAGGTTSTSSSLYHLCEGCTSLTELKFPSLMSGTNSAFQGMLTGCSGVTVHFPSNMQSTMSPWSSVTNGFGGTSVTVLWDLPATVTLNGVNLISYIRNPKHDTENALAWRIGDNIETPYYTSGTTDPSVSDTIYSDSTCTTSVTTISSIS